MSDFRLVSPFTPQGDQPQAIRELVEGLERGERDQCLLGVTGSGKTFSVAKVVETVTRRICRLDDEFKKIDTTKLSNDDRRALEARHTARCERAWDLIRILGEANAADATFGPSKQLITKRIGVNTKAMNRAIRVVAKHYQAGGLIKQR